MKTLSICVFIGLCFFMKGSSETINCYVCDDCNVLDDAQLRTCPVLGATNSPITKIPTTFLTESTTQPTQPTKSKDPPMETVSSTVSAMSTEIVTDPPKTEEPTTKTEETETTSVKTEYTRPTESETETTYRPTGSEEKQTPLPNSSGTNRPTNNLPESAETIRPSTNEPNPSAIGSSEYYNPTNAFPESSEVEPVEELRPSSILVNSVVTTNAPTAPASMINLNPTAQSPTQTSNTETVNFIAPESLNEASQFNQPYPIFNRVPRGHRNPRALPSYHCYSIEVHDGEAKKVKKGCIEVPEDKAACEVLKDQFGKSIDHCKICTEDKCNNCSTLNYSIVTLVMVLVVSLYS